MKSQNIVFPRFKKKFFNNRVDEYIYFLKGVNLSFILDDNLNFNNFLNKRQTLMLLKTLGIKFGYNCYLNCAKCNRKCKLKNESSR